MINPVTGHLSTLVEEMTLDLDCSPIDITSHRNVAFIKAATRLFEGLQTPVQVIESDYFTTSAGATRIWDRTRIARYWPQIYPPVGWTWELINALQMSHICLAHEGRFYDAECVSGVANIFELPAYQRAYGALLERQDMIPPQTMAM